MIEIENNSVPQPPKRMIRKKIWLLFLLFFLVGAGVAAFCGYREFMSLRGTMGASDTTDLRTRLAVLENRVGALEEKGKALADAPPSALDAAPSKSVVANSQTTADIARMQNDVTALSAALNAVQDEIKHSNADSSHIKAQTQSALAIALAYIQLREAAVSGHGFADELGVMRSASQRDAGLQEGLTSLDVYASSGAPTLASLREQLSELEAPALTAIDRGEAQHWWERIFAELKGLVSIRTLHGAEPNDGFATLNSDLANGDAGGALDAFPRLPSDAQHILAGWKAKLEARHAIDEALKAIGHKIIAAAHTSGSEDTP